MPRREMAEMDGLLERIGWSASHFADRIGIDERTVQAWKSGLSRGSAYRIAMLYLELVVIKNHDAMTMNDEEL